MGRIPCPAPPSSNPGAALRAIRRRPRGVDQLLGAHNLARRQHTAVRSLPAKELPVQAEERPLHLMRAAARKALRDVEELVKGFEEKKIPIFITKIFQCIFMII